MNKTNKQYFDHLSKLLGDIYQEVLLEAFVDKSGICWETITSIREKNAVERSVKYSISSGSTGIALFLLEYYKFSPGSEVKNIIRQSLLKAFVYYNGNNSILEVGFYNGRGGLIYTLVQAHKILGEEEFLALGKKLIKWPIEECKHSVFNLNSGVSGYLLGILHYYQATNDNSILSVITSLTEALISGVKIKKQGLFWDELYFSSGPLCSFIYGNSGIVFLLRELQKRFDIPGLDKIIREAIAFEDSFYCEKTANWPDLSNENIEINVSKIMSSSLLNRQRASVNTFSWSIGSPGTLLARNDSTGRNNRFKNSYEATCRYLQDNCSKSSDFTLYNGLGGVFLSCLTIDPEFDFSLDVLLLQKQKFGHLLCGYKKNRSEFDLSLFRGDTGIGYMILRLFLGKDRADTVLFPSISQAYDNIPSLNLDYVILLPLRNISSHIDFRSQSVCLKEKTYFDIATAVTAEKSTKNSLDDFLQREKFKMLQKDIDFFQEFLRLNSPPRDIKMPKKFKLGRNCQIAEFDDNHFLLIRRIGDIEVHKLSEMQHMILCLCDVEHGISGQEVLTRILGTADASEAEVESAANLTMQELSFWFQFDVLAEPD